MPGFFLHTGNRLEILVEKFSSLIEEAPPLSPFDPETVIVQSKGMERWIRLKLADRRGICANMNFPFPNAFVHSVFKAFFPELPEESPFAPETLRWRLMQTLPGLLADIRFESLAHYLKDDASGLKLFQLCGRLADLYDQYAFFRPDWMLKWETGQPVLPGDDWQAELWRRTSGGPDRRWHRPALLTAFADAVKSGRTNAAGLPGRVSLFGLSALPPFHLDVLQGLSSFMDVRIFTLDPCKEYWRDLLTEPQILRRETREGLDRDALHLEGGNPLLLSLGRLGSDFFSLLDEREPHHETHFGEPAEGTLLGRVQADILLNRAPDSAGKRKIALNDFSLQVHACHSPMREVEILHDNLLFLFENLPGLLPSDVLVMAPDITRYAPFIKAVFDTPDEERMRLPFSVSDRAALSASGVARAFLSILRLPGERFRASKVLEILEEASVRERFAFSGEDVRLVRAWIGDLRVCSGLDAKDRESLGLPAENANTWRFGLDRLFMGYGMPAGHEKTVRGILPYDVVEGGLADVFGKFADFMDRLFTLSEKLRGRQSAGKWRDDLTAHGLEAFFHAGPDSDRDIQLVRDGLSGLASCAASGGFGRDMGFDAVAAFLEEYLDRDHFQHGFLSGGVTCCTLLPMRSIPFRVICLLGMNDGAFPRLTRHQGFDLMADRKRKGDRSRREDDRYLFLETLLSARDVLYMSYLGADPRDNTPMLPSALVSEITEYAGEYFSLEDRSVRSHVVREHRLQSFSPAYFATGSRLFSYSERNYSAFISALFRRHPPFVFVDKGLPEPEASFKTVELRDLISFFENPSRFFLARRLNVRMQGVETPANDSEAFELAGLNAYAIKKALARGKHLSYPAALAMGLLPHGSSGKAEYFRLLDESAPFLEKARGLAAGKKAQPLSSFTLQENGFTLHCEIENLFEEGLFSIVPARLTPKYFIRHFIAHAALYGRRAPPFKGASVLLGEDAEFRFEAPVSPGELLGKLLALYWDGLAFPLRFFPETSFAYAEKILNGKGGADKAWAAAESCWAGGAYAGGESLDPWFSRCFSRIDPFEDPFAQAAETLFRPLLTLRRKA